MPVSKVTPTMPIVELLLLTQPFLAAGLTHFSVPSHAPGAPKHSKCTLPQPLFDFRYRLDFVHWVDAALTSVVVLSCSFAVLSTRDF